MKLEIHPTNHEIKITTDPIQHYTRTVNVVLRLSETAPNTNGIVNERDCKKIAQYFTELSEKLAKK